MLLYSRLKDEETQEYEIINQVEAEKLGWEQHDLEFSNGKFYLVGHVPEPPPPTWEEIDKLREQYREDHIDTRTKARVRKMANGTWTEEDEQAYLELDAEVTAYIEEHYPYPVEEE